jgi:hypothetical protein
LFRFALPKSKRNIRHLMFETEYFTGAISSISSECQEKSEESDEYFKFSLPNLKRLRKMTLSLEYHHDR